MSRYADLSIGLSGVSIGAWREGYSSSIAALFMDFEGDGERWVSTAATIRDRMDLLGYRGDEATATVVDGWSTRTARQNETDPVLAEELVADFVLHDGEPPVERWDHFNESAQRLQDQWGYIWARDRESLRFLVDRLPDSMPITLDISDVVGVNGIVKSPTFCADAQAREQSEAFKSLPTIVLTEGSSDAEFLGESLSLLRPDLVGYLTFLDFSMKNPGGADAVVNGLRAFAASGVGNQVIGLLDNDVAGRIAFSRVKRIGLPPRMKALLLPPLALALSYPRDSSGEQSIEDVNGSAVSIEFFAGRDVLSDESGNLIPIECGEYSPKYSAHQGAISQKRFIRKKFRDKVQMARASGEINQVDWQDMSDLIDYIVASVSK